MKIAVSKKILMACLILSVIYLYINTAMFFEENKAQPVQVYFSTSQGKRLGNAVTEKYGGLKSVEFTIGDPFNEATAQEGSSQFQIHFNNFTREVNFWYPTGNGNEEQYNQTAHDEYVSTHVPDYQISASFISGGTLPVWSQVWESGPSVSVSTNAFLHQTSFGVWEGECFFSSGFTGMRVQHNEHEETYLQVSDEKMTFNILVPNGYQIQNPERYTLAARSGGTLVSQTISAGNTFYLQVRNVIEQNLAALSYYAIPIFVCILVARAFEQAWQKRKSRKKKLRTKYLQK